MGSRKVVVLHSDKGVMIDLGDMLRETKAHSRVAPGGHHDWDEVNKKHPSLQPAMGVEAGAADVDTSDVISMTQSRGVRQGTARQGRMEAESDHGMC